MDKRITSIRGELLEDTPHARIYEGFPYNEYEAKKPVFTPPEQEFADALASALNARTRSEEWSHRLPTNVAKSFVTPFKMRMITLVESNELVDKLPSEEDWETLHAVLTGLLREHGDIVKDMDAFATYVLDYGVGYAQIGSLLRDPHLEEVMVNGQKRNVFVYHHRHGTCKTNIFVEAHDPHILRIITKASKYAGRKFHEHEPLLDARLPDGSRLNATFETVTPFGHSITIRKFTRNMLSVTQLIANNTLTFETAAFVWVMTEGMGVKPMNMIITGGSGCGKTTFLNCVGSFIPFGDRVITIEDTAELKFFDRENWISMEAQPHTRTNPGTDMNDLLTNAMRMRPDRLIVGEVRGKEAETLFIAMDTGHQGCMGTLHSNSAREMLVRLTNDPMNVPQSLLPVLDMVVVLQKVNDVKHGLQRRVSQIAEVSHMNQSILLSNLFERHPETDLLMRTDTPSHLMQVLSDAAGKNKRSILQEILVRQRVLEWMIRHRIFDPADVEKVVQQYYFDPAGIVDQVTKELEDINPPPPRKK
ncbi:MAG: ATPase, T2SS/T4P/T4SS family [Candidatus Diapherotrites archaeon]|nr:ATPase, T2SS/T4P/T4SS family [Candidatus Diapherotrites archaeon]MDZ4256457.1 ATPase, T2SS/T4P/T4SS family [archaeon]